MISPMESPNPTKLRTIVVEDERLPRLALLQKLEDFSHEVEVIGSCDNYDTALQAILQGKPDLLLLDIQLQGRDSIQLLEELRRVMPLPYVIFTTAYNDRHYLMSAIKLSAVDYLIKPIDKSSLSIALAKAMERKKQESGLQTASSNKGDEKLTLKTVSGMILLKASDIVSVSAYGNYSKVSTFRESETVMEPLGTLEELLQGSNFVRCDKSTIVNLSYVYKIDMKRNICVFRSADGTTLHAELSKSGMKRLRQML